MAGAETGTGVNAGTGAETDTAFRGLRGADPAKLFASLPTPAYVIDEAVLRQNAEILHGLMERTGCRILLAQKAFSNYDFYPLLSAYLAGTEASGLYEAKLGAEKMPGKEVHVFCGAYREQEFAELLSAADHIVFNSPGQLRRFGQRVKDAGKSAGLRINPQCSTQTAHAMYDPCAPGSRLGTTREVWNREMTPELIALLDGLHFHTLCEQDADALAVTLDAVTAQFGDILPQMKWLNLGGGHHITRDDYNLPLLEQKILQIRNKWDLQVYLEPGEAVARNAGYLASRVLDLVTDGSAETAILDTSAACHMPDVLEVPYTPPLYGVQSGALSGIQSGVQSAAQEGTQEKTQGRGYTYRLAGPTCLAGDVIGTYHFAEPLTEGQLLLFGDMAIYTTCKNNTFNGLPLPDIWKRGEDGTLTRLTQFGYTDFLGRLGSRPY